MNVTSHKPIHLECSFVAPSEFKPTATSQWLLTFSLGFHFPKKALLTLPSAVRIPNWWKLFFRPQKRPIKFRIVFQQKGFLYHFFVAKDEWLKTKIPKHLWLNLVCQRIQQQHTNKWVDTTKTYSWRKRKHWRAPTEVGTFSHFVASFQRFQLLSRLFLFNSTM